MTLALALLFSASPSLDVASYECIAFERHIALAACPGGSCDTTTPPVAVPCLIRPLADPDEYGMETVAPSPGQAVIIAVRAVDTSGNVSEWVGGP